MLKDKFHQAETVLEEAKKYGIEKCEFFAVSTKGIEVSTRLNKLENLNDSEENHYTIKIIKDYKKSSVSFTHFDKKSLNKKFETLISLADSSLPDEYNDLSDPKLFAKETVDLRMFDSTEISTQKLIEDSMEMESIGLAQKQITNSEGASSSYSKRNIFYANSNGFANGFNSTYFGKSISLIAGKDLQMQVDYDYSDGRHLNRLKSNKELALNASTRAIAKLNPKKIESQKIDIVIDRRISAGILNHLLNLISGDAIVLGKSMLKDKMGAQIFSDKINIIDDPLIPYANRSTPFDGEGLRVYKKHLIENGVLKTWLLDSYNAKKLKLESTGNAAISGGGITAWNVFIDNGTVSPEAFKAEKKVVVITDTFGPNVNYLTGDLSVGFSGEYYENGKLITPINEMTFACNLLYLFKNMVVANDLKMERGFDAPSLFVPSVTIAGI